MWDTALEGLSETERQRIEACMTRRQLAPRRMLLRQGRKAGCISVILSGRIRSAQLAWDGRESSNVFGKGAMLGVISTMLDEPAFASLETLDRAEVAQLDRASLLRLMQAIPRLSLNIAMTLARFGATSVQRRYRAEEQTPLRLAQVLCELAMLDEAGERGEIRGLTQQDLATMVNASRSWVALKLGCLESQGLIDYRRAIIVIPDLPALARYSRGQADMAEAARPRRGAA
ncbi:Crp/Fnr family transcriptional regulator [Bordetella pertussis]|uniref:Crp/Fnr family transcriptional regulator n=2 Tax=Bordetella pertussis TaxID=520 RepID=UPI002E3219DC|nr:Crp/Fnr family transcriptional regulator [Bordetella pertussis]